MGLQDDIFDVQAALENKPEAAAFDRIYTALAEFEGKADRYETQLIRIKQGAEVLKHLLQA